MRTYRVLPLLLVFAVFTAESALAQNVEVNGWRPSDWRLVPGAQVAVDSDPQAGTAPLSASRASSAWVRWGVNESTAAIASVNGNISVQPSPDGIPDGCGLASASSGNVRAFSAECVAAMALANGRQAEARAGLQWDGGDLSLTATGGLSSSLAPLSESFNPLGSLPVWLLDDSLRQSVELGGSGIAVRSQDVAIRGDWRVNSSVSVSLMGSRGQLSATSNTAAATRIEAEQTILGFGISRGSLSGTVTGQRLVPSSPLRSNQSVTAIDLGVSWRTPWQGELTLGARELSRPETPLANPTTAAKAREERTPYVQYRQDL